MNKLQNVAVGIDVGSYDQSVEAFDAFVESISNGNSPLSVMLDRLESAADALWDDIDYAKPVTLLEISRQASSGLPSGTLA